MKMPFGKYKGRELNEVPLEYLCWLAQKAEDKTLKEAATSIVAEIDYADLRLAGAEGGAREYITDLWGDAADEEYCGHDSPSFCRVRNKRVFPSLESALGFIASEYDYRGWDGFHLDPEDDRLLIWEVLPSGHRKIVWHFSGWHYDTDDTILPQGELPGQEKSLYEEMLED